MSGEARPRLVTGAAMGAIATSFLAGPTLFCIVAVFGLFGGRTLPGLEASLAGLPIALVFTSIVGLYGALPAAIGNAAILALATECEFDGWPPALLSGALCGVFIAPAGLHLFVYRNAAGYWNGEGDPTETILYLAATGALMGLVHWLIAIRRLRNWRLAAGEDVDATV